MTNTETLRQLTAEIVSAHVSHNSVGVTDVPRLIEIVYAALSKNPDEQTKTEEPVKPTPAVPVRGSVKRDHIISLLDGKPYKTLRRHLATRGYTPDTYREAFGLPRDYPMVASAYSEQRRETAQRTGLGRRDGGGAERKPEPANDAGAAPKGRRKAPAAKPKA